MIINTKNLTKARKLINKAKSDKKRVIVQAQDIDFNRKILENKNTEILILNHKLGKDQLKQRNSGLNHILCKIAKKNNITLAIDLNELNIKDKKTKAEILSRIIQNIKLIKKYKNNLVVINKIGDIHNIKSLFLILGLPTNMIKKAV